MDFEDLRHFEHLAEALHFGHSARARGLSPSALTRRIQALEAEVGRPLFQRDQRRVELTDAGQIFRRFARRQLEQWDELQNTLLAEQESPTGELDIACTVTACHTILPTLLSRFRARYPKVTLRLLTQDAAHSKSQLEAGELDLAVIPTDADQVTGLKHQVLADTRLLFVSPKNLASLGVPGLTEKALQRPGALNGLPLVAPIGGLERSRLDQWLLQQNVVPHIVAEVRGNEGVLALVSLGSGIGLVPELVLTNSPLKENIRVLTLVSPLRGYEVSLCARPRSLERRVVSAFWELTAELLTPSGRAP